VLAGGGTAGHLEPALATAVALEAAVADVRLTFLGTSEGVEATLLPARGRDLTAIPRVPIPRRPGTDLMTLPRRLRGAVKAAEAVLDEVAADVVVGFGGYVAGPAYLAARRREVPVVIHEANIRPGLANRLGARFAAAVAVASDAVDLPGAQVIGIPLRAEIATLDRSALREEGRRAFGLPADAPLLLAFGGSQGARRINNAVAEAAAALSDAGVLLLHATGRGQDTGRPQVPGYHRVEYLDRIECAYAAADLVLCRAGALTVAELTAVGLPAIYVPLPIGNGEQRLNAVPVVAAGGGLLLDDADCTGAAVTDLVLSLLGDDERLTAMGQAARASGNADAADRLAELVLAAVREPS
jgi:UDP-N-acetylglucosamine--N-acetylmuramyl-(pentapeptide) pyrophosphoryl-undecaprenol N-acetylglucosamine transferase